MLPLIWNCSLFNQSIWYLISCCSPADVYNCVVSPGERCVISPHLCLSCLIMTDVVARLRLGLGQGQVSWWCLLTYVKYIIQTSGTTTLIHSLGQPEEGRREVTSFMHWFRRLPASSPSFRPLKKLYFFLPTFLIYYNWGESQTGLG